MNKVKTDVDVVYEKMNDERLRFTDRLVDEIIDYTIQDIELSESDVKDLAIYTLHSIIVLGNQPESTIITKQFFNDLIGDFTKTINYLDESLGGISATDDAIADEVYENELCANAGLSALFGNGGVDNGEC